MRETIIITGGNGFVGKHLIQELQQRTNHSITVWDTNLTGLPRGARGLQVDITNPETYQDNLTTYQPTWIMHLAAFSTVGDSWKEAKTVQQTNVVATQQLLEATQARSPHARFFAVSSADIYGLSADVSAEARAKAEASAQEEQGMPEPLPELPLAQAHPRNPYGHSKWAMEKVIEDRFNDLCVRVRPFPHIGPGQRTGFVTADFASQIAAIEAGQQPPVIKVGNLDAVRDFTDVRDVVRAYALLLEKGQRGEVYHVATGHGVRINEILHQLLSLSKVTITVETDPERLRPSEIPILIGDASKLRHATGWQPAIPLEQSLQDILNYWREKVKQG